MADSLHSQERVARYGAYALLCTMTLAAFWPVFTLGFIRYDDTLYITDNPGVKQGISLGGLRYAATAIVSGNYHPLTVVSHQLDVSLFGLRPAGHHAISLLLHIANACLLFRLLCSMTSAPWRCFLVSAVFAIHPLHVESVAWVSERKDVLSTCFMFLTMGAYVRYVRSGRRAVYFRMIGLYALALLAKPMPVTLPLVLLLLDRWPLRRTIDGGLRDYARELPALTMEKWPLFALSAASCTVTYLVQRGAGATRDLDTVSLSQRTMNATVAYATYLWKSFVPTNLAPNYPLVDISPWLFLVCLAVLLAISAASLVLFRSRPYVFGGWFWFVGMLVPVIGFVQIGNQALADRYMYVPMIGLTIAIAWLIPDSIARKRAPRVAGLTAISAIVVVFCAVSNAQMRLWRDSETLFTHTLRVSPRSSVAHKILGLEYAKRGDYQTALVHFQQANELNPTDRDNAFNLGTAYLNLDEIDEAISWLRISTETYDKPADAHANLGRALLEKSRNSDPRGHMDELAKLFFNAMHEFEKAIELDANHVDAHINLGIALGMSGHPDEATEVLAEAVRLAPDNPDARYNYGVALLVGQKKQAAMEQFEGALRLRPGFTEAAESLARAREEGER